MSKTQIFIEKARAKHGDRYNYGRVVYVRSRDKVVITCKRHGDFEQRPSDHLNGQGCADCGKESEVAKKTEESKNSFIDKSRAVHGDRYDYTNVEYVNAMAKVSITCANHGDFKQRPNDHLSGSGCAKCAGIYSYSTQEWVQEAIAAHGYRYDYSKTVYVCSSDKVTINCKKHGDFEQTPNGHLSGRGCPSCPSATTSPPTYT